MDHWRNSDQKQRWLATALLDLEPQLRRIKNYEALPLLQQALHQYVEKGQKSAAKTREPSPNFSYEWQLRWH